MSPILPSLPIDSMLEEIRAKISAGFDVILKASPGSGKTTRVPPGLLSTVSGQIWVLEPRRLAARMSAQRVAFELGEPPGGTVGWQMRFDRQYSDKTRILFLTEGMFTARLAQDPNLTGVDCILLDEFHERHQQTDVAFALCRQLQATTRPDLRLIVMSATLDVGALAEKLPEAKNLTLELPLFPVSVRHNSYDTSSALVEKVVSTSLNLSTDPSHSGHILVFLPGTAEIIRCKNQLQRHLDGTQWLILELRGSLEKNIQDLVFQETGKRKIVLSTNIAESSVTIPGVTAVIDPGLARVPLFNPFSGLTTLETRPVSKASIIQRSGRAGRTGAGVAVRLFSLPDEAARPEVDVPEILRLDLAQVYMNLLWLSLQTGKQWLPESLPWLNPPESRQWAEARKLLELLEIISKDGQFLRSQAATLPLSPRIARFALACVETGLSAESPWLAAMLAEPVDVKTKGVDHSHLGCDLLATYELVRANPNAHISISKSANQLAKMLTGETLKAISSCKQAHELDLAPALLKAFPDRVFQIRGRKSGSSWIDGTMCGGGDIQLSPDSAASHGEWIIALNASSSRVTGSAHAAGTQSPSQRALVTQASIIEPADMTHVPSGFLVTEDISDWDETTGKTRMMRKTRYGILNVSTVTLSVSDAPPVEAGVNTNKRLATLMKQNWPKPFSDAVFFDEYITRLRLAFEAKQTDHAWNKDELFELLIAHIADDATSLEDVSRHTLEEWLRFCVGEDEFIQLQKLAPTSITVGQGYKVKVHYPENAAPWIEARLQNFFGQTQTPKILNDRLPLTVHLLAPNMRALQVTTDLASFWQKTYPMLRNEYQRKYPRHLWPEDPSNATPPPVRPPRKR